MDDHEGKPQPSGFHLNGLLPDQSASVTRVLDTERWSRAEKRVAQLIDVIQPNQASENRRNAIESYMSRLITECFSCQIKLVKCIAENIVMDISFNQLGDLCALCYLEELLYRFVEFAVNLTGITFAFGAPSAQKFNQ